MSQMFKEVIELPGLWPNFGLCAALKVEQNYNKKLIDICEEVRRLDPNGQQASNRGFGWQGLYQENSQEPFQPLFESASEMVNQYAKKLGKRPNVWEFGRPWFNVSGYKDANQMHTHGGDLSAVYYLQVPKGSGQIVFTHPLAFVGYYESIVGEFHDLVVRVTPQEGLLIVFSASTPHWVDPSQAENSNRISLSFNGNRPQKAAQAAAT